MLKNELGHYVRTVLNINVYLVLWEFPFKYSWLREMLSRDMHLKGKAVKSP